MKFTYVDGYHSNMSALENAKAIKKIKDTFEQKIAKTLKLYRVTAPLMVKSNTGINDDLNGCEESIKFTIPNIDQNVEIVHSLAKWKRIALREYNIALHEGIYTDMNAIRKDEILDEYHSIYVDQWDYELVISQKERTITTLKRIVRKIYKTLKEMEQLCFKEFNIEPLLPKDIFFITTQELENMYPSLTPKERENQIIKVHKAIFLMKIGKKLKSGIPHDGRAPDYDDWELNGDILVYNPVLDNALELSSMGIRVDEKTLLKQLKISKDTTRLNYYFHNELINGRLPYSLGGGIGQSRICMFFLRKLHIGEVQASIWSDEMLQFYRERKVNIL